MLYFILPCFYFWLLLFGWCALFVCCISSILNFMFICWFCTVYIFEPFSVLYLSFLCALCPSKNKVCRGTLMHRKVVLKKMLLCCSALVTCSVLYVFLPLFTVFSPLFVELLSHFLKIYLLSLPFQPFRQLLVLNKEHKKANSKGVYTKDERTIFKFKECLNKVSKS